MVTPASLNGTGCAVAVPAASVDASNNATKIVLFTNTSSPRRGLLHRTDRQALNDLDARAPGIRDVGDRVAGGALADWLIELDALRLETLHEGGVVAHVKPEVIEHAAARRRLFRVGRVEPELNPRQVHDRRIVAGGGLAAEDPRGPGQ